MSAARRSGPTLGRYELGEIIGTGGVAEAWRASFGGDAFRKTVVVKRVRPELRANVELHAAFLREARIAQRLQHGNVVQVLDVGDDDGVPYIVLEHVDGCSLQTLMERGPLPPAVAIHVAEQVAIALQHAHAAEDDDGAPLGLVHRDVTPGNVLLSKDGVVKLGDFGIARVLAGGHDTLPGFIKGTPIYLAPEQAAGRPVDARADVYSLGLVLRRMLVEGGELDAIDPELAAIVLAATEPSVKDRLPSAAALFARLQSFRAAQGIGSATEALAQRVRTAIGVSRRRARAIDAALQSTASGTRQLAAPPPASPRRIWLPLVTVLALAIAAAAIAMRPRDPSPSAATAAPVDLRVVPAPRDPPADPPALPRPPPLAEAATAPALAPETPVKPKKRMGNLDVNVVPYAEVEVDGKPRGAVPKQLRLEVGRHTVALYNPHSGKRVEREVTIEAGRTFAITSWDP